jgi:hypothetical protein
LEFFGLTSLAALQHTCLQSIWQVSSDESGRARKMVFDTPTAADACKACLPAQGQLIWEVSHYKIMETNSL